MDNQFRLTLWNEWRVGDRYLWLKGGAVTMAGKCVSAQMEDGYVCFEHASGDLIKTWAWKGRYIKNQPLPDGISRIGSRKDDHVRLHQAL